MMLSKCTVCRDAVNAVRFDVPNRIEAAGAEKPRRLGLALYSVSD
jgi:hypothetical protein